ncbi:efflux RND transporter periplasmic adaptor subunit [Flexibacterium corallicola]|uniref:efflux RND transporter periplasmic adaptor subunit n=1 Tax=Flexibacterium corallicola TaxID=3037259 RepID=UPI00286F16B6|nr:efflux RND transporter periplasmic adaptor subunit [Pseudovibrio sp. M1P-2-3]
MGTKISFKATVSASIVAIGLAASSISLLMNPSGGEALADSANAAPPPPPVSVFAVVPSQEIIWKEFTGRLAAVETVDLRPQVSGTIEEVRFEDGQEVSAGDILFVIDPEPYKAAVAEAEAELAVARHSVTLAAKQRARGEDLVKRGHLATSIVDERITDHTGALSREKSAEARLQQAKINLERAFVKTPISGRVSRAELTLGNIAQAGATAPLLTSIVSSQQIFADFDVDERTYLGLVRAATKTGHPLSSLAVEVLVDFGEIEEQVFQGTIKSFDNQADPLTGTIRARAIFENKDGSLLPGLFAQVRIADVSQKDLILLGENQIGTDQDRKFVYVVDEKNTVTYRQISLGVSVNGKRVVQSGLKTGDLVVSEALMRVRPGMVVTPRKINTAQTAVN